MDALINTLDTALRTLFAKPHMGHPCENLPSQATELTPDERSLSGALMRVNHVGEVCAQALYTAQSLATKNPSLKDHFGKASSEEANHLAWTQQRLDELGARPSLLNPLWFAGAFSLGLIAGKLGDRWSLGFVVETERQVEAHLGSHLHLLPEKDFASRAIVTQMIADEARHAAQAQQAGAQALPKPIKSLMSFAAKVMTTVAHRI